jgi:DNA-binding GntR family transcriptional regulator
MAGRVLARLTNGSRGHGVATVLRQAIIEGRMQPGDRLLELDLAAQLGTSRGPVREALRQLETEGLVVSYPYRGTMVAEVSQDEIEEVLVPIRLIIERFAFRRAVALLADDDVAALHETCEQMRAAANSGDVERLADADIRFHELVIERSGQTHCLQLWRTIQPRVRAYFRRDAPGHLSHFAVAEQHEELLRALTSGDEARLLTAVDAHIHHHLRG